MKLRVIRVDLPLKHVFATSRSSFSVVRTIVVELEQDGLRGHGEAYEDPFYGSDIEEMVSQVEKCRESLDSYALADPTALWRRLEPFFSGEAVGGSASFARSAVDCAACDLWGKMKNKPLWKIWGLSKETVPYSAMTIGLDSLERIAERFEETPNWPIYRVKLGEKDDINILRMLREKTAVPFHVDVDGGWNYQTAAKNLAELHQLGVVLLEQPLPADDFAGTKKLRKEIKKRGYEMPLMADESWRNEADLDRCVDVFDGVNVKLVKCGGLTPARQFIGKAKHLGLKLMSANSVESTVGVSAIAQLAPLLDYLSVDGPLLIEKKVGTGVRSDNGHLIYPDENGTGVRVVFR